jgi:hypothetical protein
MAQLQIKLSDGQTAFSPLETVSGSVTWELDTAPKKAELCLVWSTKGKGTADIAVVETVNFAQPQPRDIRSFAIILPASPYTFSGQLISLIWNLELTVDPGDLCESVEIVVAPGGREVLLPRIQPAS